MLNPPKYDEKGIAEVVENQIDYWIEQQNQEVDEDEI